MDPGYFSSRQAAAIAGLSTRQLAYWRRTGLVTPQHRTPGGHARYSFTDLIALRAARQLLRAGVSVQRMRRCLRRLTELLPQIRQPLGELSLVVTGDVVLVLHTESAFDALSGQEWIFPVAELAAEVERLRHERPEPLQGELFDVATDDAAMSRAQGAASG